MKAIFVVLVLALCATSSLAALANTVPPLPDPLPGYKTYTLVQVKRISLLLNAYTALVPAFVVSAINAKALPPQSFSVFMRQAYVKNAVGGYTVVYFVRLHNPRVMGMEYYGSMTAFVANTAGYKTSLQSLNIAAAVQRT